MEKYRYVFGIDQHRFVEMESIVQLGTLYCWMNVENRMPVKLLKTHENSILENYEPVPMAGLGPCFLHSDDMLFLENMAKNISCFRWV